MDLKDRNGFIFIKEEELHKWERVCQFVPILRNSISKTWRLVSQFEKLLIEATDNKSENKGETK